MEHGFDLTAMAIVAAAAAFSGFVLLRLRQPALVGFILAGVILGPSGFAFVNDPAEVAVLAELGVLLLLFVVGLEINLHALRNTVKVVFLCAVMQALVGIGSAAVLGWTLDWPLERTLLIGFVLSLSSTAVGIKLLDQLGEARTEAGRITVGVLVAQDLLIVPMLIIVNALGREAEFDTAVFGQVAIAFLVFGGLILKLSRSSRIKLPLTEYMSRDVDAGPLAAIAFCLSVATVSSLLGLSPAFGAFLAGLVLSASTVRRQVLRVSLPLQSILLMVFFLSIGLMVDLQFILSKAFIIFGLLFIVLPAKTVVNLVVLRILGVPARQALIASAVMAQLGEFGFVLAAAGLAVGAIAADGYQIALSVIALSLAASPLWTAAARRIVAHPKADGDTARELLANVFASEISTTRNILDAVVARLKNTHR